MTRTGWGLLVAAVTLVAAALLTGLPELLVVGFGAGLALVVGLVWSRRQPTLRVERRIDPPRVVVGEPARVHLVVTNESQRSARRATLTERIGGVDQPIAVGALAAAATATVSYDLPTSRRRVIELGPASLHQGDPFGVVDATVHVGDIDRFVVHPRQFALTGFPSARDRALDGPEARRVALGSMSFHTLRDYAPGDDLRHVHWKSSARTGSLMVRQFVDSEQHDVTVLLDVADHPYGEAEFEGAVEAVASIAAVTVASGVPMRFTTSGTADRLVRPPDLVALLDRLAAVERDPGADLGSAVDRIVAGRPEGPVVVVTGRSDPNHMDRLTSLAARSEIVVLAELRSDVSPSIDATSLRVRRLHARDGVTFAEMWNQGIRW